MVLVEKSLNYLPFNQGLGDDFWYIFRLQADIAGFFWEDNDAGFYFAEAMTGCAFHYHLICQTLFFGFIDESVNYGLAIPCSTVFPISYGNNFLASSFNDYILPELV
jgi:hypothetical protein